MFGIRGVGLAHEAAPLMRLGPVNGVIEVISFPTDL